MIVEKQGPSLVLKRRIFRRTQSSSQKKLDNFFELKQNGKIVRQKTLSAFDNQTSSQTSQSKIRVVSNSSSKNLFREAKSKSVHQSYLKQNNNSNFSLPTNNKSKLTLTANFSNHGDTIRSSVHSPKYQTIDSSAIQSKKQHLNHILQIKNDKSNNHKNNKFNKNITNKHYQTKFNTIDSQETVKQSQLHHIINSQIKQYHQNLHLIKNEAHKKIEQAFSYKFNFEEKKQNIKNSSKAPIKDLISEYVQTEEVTESQPKNQRRVLKEDTTRKFYTENSEELKHKPKPEQNNNVQKVNTVVNETKKIDLFQKNNNNKPKHLNIPSGNKDLVPASVQSQSESIISDILPKGDLKIKKVKEQKNNKSENEGKQFFKTEDELDFDLEDIVLSPQSRVVKNNENNIKNKLKKNQEAEIQRLQKQKKEKQKAKLQEQKKRANRQKQIQKQKQKQKQRQIQQEKKEKQKLQNKRNNIQNQKQIIQKQLIKANQVIDLITPVGEVAGYCSKKLKKVKVNWYLPAILLYKQCYQKFISYEDIYIKAYHQGILSDEEKQRYIEDNQTIKKNLQKIIQMANKKGKLDKQELKLIQSGPQVQLNLYIQDAVHNFANQFELSPQKDNDSVQQCLLRMINGVLILGRLHNLYSGALIQVDKISSQKMKDEITRNLKLISTNRLKF